MELAGGLIQRPAPPRMLQYYTAPPSTAATGPGMTAASLIIVGVPLLVVLVFAITTLVRSCRHSSAAPGAAGGAERGCCRRSHKPALTPPATLEQAGDVVISPLQQYQQAALAVSSAGQPLYKPGGVSTTSEGAGEESSSWAGYARLHASWMKVHADAVAGSYRSTLFVLFLYALVAFGIHVSAGVPHYHAPIACYTLLALLLLPSAAVLGDAYSFLVWGTLLDVVYLILRRTSDGPGPFGMFVLLNRQMREGVQAVVALLILGILAAILMKDQVKAATTGRGLATSSGSYSVPGSEPAFGRVMHARNAADFLRALGRAGPGVFWHMGRKGLASLRTSLGGYSNVADHASSLTHWSCCLFYGGALSECVGTVPMYNSVLALCALLAARAQARMIAWPAVLVLLCGIVADLGYLLLSFSGLQNGFTVLLATQTPEKSSTGLAWFQLCTTLVLALLKAGAAIHATALCRSTLAEDWPAGGVLDRRALDLAWESGAASEGGAPTGCSAQYKHEYTVREKAVLLLTALIGAATTLGCMFTGFAYGHAHALAVLDIAGLRYEFGSSPNPGTWSGGQGLFYSSLSWITYRSLEKAPEISLLSVPTISLSLCLLVWAALASRGRWLAALISLSLLYTVLLDIAWLGTYAQDQVNPDVPVFKVVQGDAVRNNWEGATGLSLSNWRARTQAQVGLAVLSLLFKLPLLLFFSEWARAHLTALPLPALYAVVGAPPATAPAKPSPPVPEAAPQAQPAPVPLAVAVQVEPLAMPLQQAAEDPSATVEVEASKDASVPVSVGAPAPIPPVPTVPTTSSTAAAEAGGAPGAASGQEDAVVMIENPAWSHPAPAVKEGEVVTVNVLRSVVVQPSASPSAAPTARKGRGVKQEDLSLWFALISGRWLLPFVWSWQWAAGSSSAATQWQSSVSASSPASSASSSRGTGAGSSGGSGNRPGVLQMTKETFARLAGSCLGSSSSGLGLGMGMGGSGGRAGGDPGWMLVIPSPGQKPVWVKLAEPALLLPSPGAELESNVRVNPLRAASAADGAPPPTPPAGLHYVQIRMSAAEAPRYVLVQVVDDGAVGGGTTPGAKAGAEPSAPAPPALSLSTAQLARLASLPDPQGLAQLAEDIKGREEKLRALQAQLATEGSNTAKQQSLMNEYESLASAVREQKAKAVVEGQRATIAGDDTLSDYASLLSLKLNGAILACLSLHSGLAQAAAGDSKGEKVGAVIKMINDSVGAAVPGAGLVLGLLSAAATFQGEWERKRAIQRVATAFRGAAASEAVTDALSRRLTLALVPELRRLQEMDDMDAIALKHGSRAGWMRKQLEKMKELKRVIEVSDVTGRVCALAEKHAALILQAVMTGAVPGLGAPAEDTAGAGVTPPAQSWDVAHPEACALMLARVVPTYVSAEKEGSTSSLPEPSALEASTTVALGGGTAATTATAAQQEAIPDITAGGPTAADLAGPDLSSSASAASSALIARIELVAGQVARVESALSIMRDEQSTVLAHASSTQQGASKQLKELSEQVSAAQSTASRLLSEAREMHERSGETEVELAMQRSEAAAAHAEAVKRSKEAEQAANDARAQLLSTLSELSAVRAGLAADSQAATEALKGSLGRAESLEREVQALKAAYEASLATAREAQELATAAHKAHGALQAELALLSATYKAEISAAASAAGTAGSTAAAAKEQAAAASAAALAASAAIQAATSDSKRSHEEGLAKLQAALAAASSAEEERARAAGQAAAAAQAKADALQAALQTAVAEADKHRQATAAESATLLSQLEQQRASAAAAFSDSLDKLRAERGTVEKLGSLLSDMEAKRAAAEGKGKAWRDSVQEQVAASMAGVTSLLSTLQAQQAAEGGAAGAGDKAVMSKKQAQALTSSLQTSLAAMQAASVGQAARLQELERALADMRAERAALVSNALSTPSSSSSAPSVAGGQAKKGGWFWRK